MKRKSIEKIPYMGLRKVKRGKAVEYVAVTGTYEIGGKDHLFIEVYRNSRKCKTVPKVRIVLTKNDFGTFFPEGGVWSTEKVDIGSYINSFLIWRRGENKVRSRDAMDHERNIMQSDQDLQILKKFTDRSEFVDDGRWWDHIQAWQDGITHARNRAQRDRKRERRERALKDRIENTPVLPEKEILEYADQELFGSRHYLYYRKHKSRAELACTKCGGVVDARWKEGMSYESQFERMIEEPKRGFTGKCPLCNEMAEYLPAGHVKEGNSQKIHLFIGQKYKDGIVIRYLEVEKEYHLDVTEDNGREKLHGAYEELSGIEIARAYFEQGKKLQIDYHKHNPWKGEDFWDDCNLYGNANINVKAGVVMPETYTNMQGTFLQYSAMEEYQKVAGDINPINYLERYIHTPQIEMLVKIGLTGVVDELMKYHYGIVADENAQDAGTFLGIRKERVKQLISHHGKLNMLDVMQCEKRFGANLTEGQIEKLAILDIKRLGQIREYMSIQKFLNRVEKYAGVEICEELCGRAHNRIQNVAGEYLDYLSMRRNLGYDMQNTVYLFPRDLEKAHDKMVAETAEKADETKIMRVNREYTLIRKNYRKLRRKFYYEDEDYLIRPARDAGEIVSEGRILHHCVGGADYLNKHNEGISTILFLRKKENPDVPYITVEIGNNGNIIQWYGRCDKKPDKDRMQRWIDAYENRLKYGAAAAGDGMLMVTA